MCWTWWTGTYLTENGMIMNRSRLSKVGIKVAELVAAMRPKVA